MKKPWSQMSDDEKLEAIFLFMGSFFAQFICVVVLTFALGTTTPADILVGSSRQWLNFPPALVGIPLATLFFAWKPLRKSGYWIWLPGTLADIYDILFRGLHEASLLPPVFRRGPYYDRHKCTSGGVYSLLFDNVRNESVDEEKRLPNGGRSGQEKVASLTSISHLC